MALNIMISFLNYHLESLSEDFDKAFKMTYLILTHLVKCNTKTNVYSLNNVKILWENGLQGTPRCMYLYKVIPFFPPYM